MSKETTGENQPNQENVEGNEANMVALKKENETLKIQKSRWRKKAKDAESKVVPENKTTKKEAKKSDEPDSIRIAYEALLNTLGYKHPDDKKYIFDEAEKLKISPSDVVKMEHAKLQLKTSKTQREAEGGMPEGGGKKGGGTKSSVDYWVNKTDKDGGYENPPNDPALTIKVVNARMEKERKKQEFPD